MKLITSCFLYILLTVLYCLYTGSMTLYIYLVGQCTVLLFIVALCGFILRPTALTYNERLFVWFSLLMSACRTLYTTLCVFRGKPWVLYHTDVFGMITAFCFLVLLLHICFSQAIKK